MFRIIIMLLLSLTLAVTSFALSIYAGVSLLSDTMQKAHVLPEGGMEESKALPSPAQDECVATSDRVERTTGILGRSRIRQLSLCLAKCAKDTLEDFCRSYDGEFVRQSFRSIRRFGFSSSKHEGHRIFTSSQPMQYHAIGSQKPGTESSNLKISVTYAPGLSLMSFERAGMARQPTRRNTR